MNYRLERLVDGEWYKWGVYNVEDDRDAQAMVEAAAQFGREGYEVRVIKE